MNGTNNTLKIFVYAAILAIIGTALIEVINWYLGYNEFNALRELNIFLINFLVGLVAGYFRYKKNSLQNTISL